MPKKVIDWKGFAKQLEDAPHRWHCLPNVRRTAASNLRRGEVKPVRMLGGTISVKQMNGHVDELGVERGDVWAQWTPEGEDVRESPPPPLIREARKRSDKPAPNRNGSYAIRVPAADHQRTREITALAGVPITAYLRQIVSDFLVGGSSIDLRRDATVNVSIPDETWDAAEVKAMNEYGVPLRRILIHELKERLDRDLGVEPPSPKE